MSSREEYVPVITTLAKSLRAMDVEAVPLPTGTPVGLWWYARHRRRDEALPKNCRNEEDWSRKLKELLDGEGMPTVTERFYPRPPKRRCDLVIAWPEVGRLWLEVKGAWRHNNSRGTVKNSAYRKHLDAAADDLGKIGSLDTTVADHVGVLLVGFDTSTDPIPPDDVDVVRHGSRTTGWVEHYEQWDDLYRPNGRVRVWLWLRRAASNPDGAGG